MSAVINKRQGEANCSLCKYHFDPRWYSVFIVITIIAIISFISGSFLIIILLH